jgi:hypothetical protein
MYLMHAQVRPEFNYGARERSRPGLGQLFSSTDISQYCFLVHFWC